MMLDFRIDTFLTVCKFMNYTKAAEALHITQPAVSQHIHALEEEYGVKLFSYKGKRLALTEAGQILQDTAVTMKHDDLLLKEMMEQMTSGSVKLIFGATRTVGQFAMADPLIGYLKQHPKATVKMTVANTQKLLKMLDNGDIDFAIVEGFFPKSEYDFLVFSKENFTAVCSPDYSFQKPIHKIEDLLQERLLVREKGSGTRNIFETYLKSHDLALKDFPYQTEVNNIDVLKTLAKAGCGITFLYETAVKKELAAGTLSRIPLEDFSIKHNFTFLWQKSSAFSEHYRNIFREFKFYQESL
jgi:DNA-binding transcriptional LysR family regulator